MRKKYLFVWMLVVLWISVAMIKEHTIQNLQTIIFKQSTYLEGLSKEYSGTVKRYSSLCNSMRENNEKLIQAYEVEYCELIHENELLREELKEKEKKDENSYTG